ncbi:MAG: hypothetical protein JO006_03500 [Paucibacter sp.]|nr:hypothetical protein [Roseateles sp.]
MNASSTYRRQFGQNVPDRPLRRFYPLRGHLLTLGQIRGPWRPSGAVGCAGVFAVVWSTRRGDYWAPLHDFEAADQLRLIDACRRLDQAANFKGCWPEGMAT